MGGIADETMQWRKWMPLFAVLVASGGYTTVQTRDTFSGADAARMQERVKTLEQRISGLPPAWLTEDLGDIKREIRELRQTVQTLEIEMKRATDRG